MSKYNCGCNNQQSCGCSKPNLIGCPTKVDLLCTNYSGIPLSTLDIDPGLDGNAVIKKINDYLEDLPNPEEQNILIDNVGGEIELYKGIEVSTFIHQFKTIRGIQGIIVRDKPNSDCENGGNVVDILLDTQWLNQYLNQWIQTVDLCPLIRGCTTPPEPTNNPVVTSIVKTLANRATYTFTDLDFLSHYSDLDNHPLNSITITGSNLIGYKYNNVQLVSGTEIPLFNIATGALTYTGDDTDIAYNKTVAYKAKDSSGAFSNDSTITFNVAQKILLVFNTPTVNLTRGISNTKTSSITFSNGTGQNIPSGHVFINQGTVGQPGHLRITSTSQVVATGTGSIPIQIVSTPQSTQTNQTVNYTYDGSSGAINLTYMSIPVVNNDINKSALYLQNVNFTNADFTNNSFDFDGDIVEARILAETSAGVPSSLTGYKYNGVNYTGQWISVNNLSGITYTPENITAGYNKKNKWQVRDSQGNIST
jgi:hypothetical protein